MLRKILTQKQSVKLPKETNYGHFNFKQKVLPGTDFQVSLISKQDSDQVRKYMLQTFYKQAPIPCVLKLNRPQCNKTQKFLNEEIEYFVNSGVSIKFTRLDSADIIGIGFSYVWSHDPQYQVIETSVQNWHNTAADIVANVSENERHLVWRHLQWHHIYNLGQAFLRRSGKDKVFYLAMLYLNEDIRAGKLSQLVINELIYSDMDNNTSLLVQSNFRGFDKTVHQIFSDPILLDQVKYSQEDLVLDSAQGRAFQIIDHLDGIHFYGNL